MNAISLRLWPTGITCKGCEPMNDETAYIMAWQSLPDIGSRTIRKLVQALGSAEAAWHTPAAELEERNLLGEIRAAKLDAQRRSYDFDRSLQQLQDQHIQCITWWDTGYPALLKYTYNPPALLFYKGILKTDVPTLAIVGSRKASAYGKNTAFNFAAALAKQQFSIVSGGARGIDTQAHKGALSASGYTISVVANGLDRVYPGENIGLFRKIVETGGAIITEYPLGTPPNAGNFPARNRIISGLSHGVLVIEAALRSGSLITADFALEEGRDVFAIPGSIYSATSAGTNKLIGQGAMPIGDPHEILTEWCLDTLPTPKEEATLTPKEAAVLQHLTPERSVTLEDLCLKTKMMPKELGIILLQLCLKGFVRDEGACRYSTYKKEL